MERTLTFGVINRSTMALSNLLGEYDCKLDPKGRMRMPSGLISQLGEEGKNGFVLNRGFEKCLVLYPRALWDQIAEEVNQLNLYKPENREFARYFFRGAQEISLDAADRILLSKRLTDYAGIDKDVILSAYSGRIEIWAKEIYDTMLDQEPEDLANLANEVLGKEDKRSE